MGLDVGRVLERFAAMECQAKVRCSRGLSVDSLYAPWPHMQGLDRSTFAVPRLSADANFMFSFKHDDRIETKKAFLQLAILYTDAAGVRKIRVHTSSMSMGNSLSNMFRQTDVDVVTALLSRQAATRMLSGGTHPREFLANQVINVLHSYRANCASTTSAGQLILPESLKMLPLFTLSLLKMPAFRAAECRSDERAASLANILTTPLLLATSLIYPRVFPIFPKQAKDKRGGTPTGKSNF